MPQLQDGSIASKPIRYAASRINFRDRRVAQAGIVVAGVDDRDTSCGTVSNKSFGSSATAGKGIDMTMTSTSLTTPQLHGCQRLSRRFRRRKP